MPWRLVVGKKKLLEPVLNDFFVIYHAVCCECGSNFIRLHIYSKKLQQAAIKCEQIKTQMNCRVDSFLGFLPLKRSVLWLSWFNLMGSVIYVVRFVIFVLQAAIRSNCKNFCL